jgi:hypothetical protein
MKYPILIMTLILGVSLISFSVPPCTGPDCRVDFSI